jgi:hypothetical protein
MLNHLLRHIVCPENGVPISGHRLRGPESQNRQPFGTRESSENRVRGFSASPHKAHRLARVHNIGETEAKILRIVNVEDRIPFHSLQPRPKWSTVMKKQNFPAPVRDLRVQNSQASPNKCGQTGGRSNAIEAMPFEIFCKPF